MTVPHRSDVETLWDYTRLHQQPRPVDVAVGLGGHDIGVAEHTAALYHRGLFPLIVFTGASGPTTVGRFPRGEAIGFREHAIRGGVPGSAILVETEATNTGENIDLTRRLLDAHGYGASISSVMLICRPYQQRRSYAICRKRWPDVEVLCASQPLELGEYLTRIGDVDRVINMLVGDTQRIWVYAARGWAIEQDVPAAVRDACSRLVAAGYTRRLLPE